ncbi:nascent polypeptide-associated complex subunit alpha, muscle-specific form-like [Eriocheir sinensis]|uniref:nascent polypeptide-associated complex subunit alpha, muscle-specific form-like n=1 Tax=Eriocheir sinensis TaxID=95602 RepID=UPI0021CA864B|nr:nascent polypeptide-associated complex subunit alpha, muscle-specific form-like [Eriocheir sinensis]
MSSDKRVRPASDSESSDSESPADKQLRLESGSESDEAALIPLPDSSDEDWVVVGRVRDRAHRSHPPPPPSPPRSRSPLGTSATPTLPSGSRPTPFPRSTATAPTAATSTASTAAPTSASAAAHSNLLGAVSHPEQAAARHAAASPANPKVVVPPTPGFETALDLAEALEEELGLRLQMRFLENGSVLVTPPSDEAIRALMDTTSVHGKAVQLRLMGDATTKGVVTTYPVAMPLKALLRHPSVVTAERCMTRDNLATRQVLISHHHAWSRRCPPVEHSGSGNPASGGVACGPQPLSAGVDRAFPLEVPASACPTRSDNARLPGALPGPPTTGHVSRQRCSGCAATSYASSTACHATPPGLLLNTSPSPTPGIRLGPLHAAHSRSASTGPPPARKASEEPRAAPPRDRASCTTCSSSRPCPGHQGCTRGMLASFALALTGLLKLTPDEAALRVIAKATVEECFPTIDSPVASPATPLQTPVAAPPAVQAPVRGDAPPPAAEAHMEVDAPSRAAVAPAVSVAQPAQASQTAKPRSHIPVQAAPTRSRIPQPKGIVTPKRRGPAPSRAAAPVIAKWTSSETDRLVLCCGTCAAGAETLLREGQSVPFKGYRAFTSLPSPVRRVVLYLGQGCTSLFSSASPVRAVVPVWRCGGVRRGVGGEQAGLGVNLGRGGSFGQDHREAVGIYMDSFLERGSRSTTDGSAARPRSEEAINCCYPDFLKLLSLANDEPTAFMEGRLLAPP